MKKAIIFDLYDTLLTVKNKSNPYIYLLNNCSGNSKDIITDLITNDYSSTGFINYLEMIKLLKSPVDKVEFLKLLDQEVESVEYYPDTVRVLARLKQKYRLFCLSNLATPYKYPYYRLNLENYMEHAFFSCDEEDKKPNPSFFQKVIDYSGLQKEDFIMIGDNPISDIKGAIDFGIEARLKKNITLEELTKDLWLKEYLIR